MEDKLVMFITEFVPVATDWIPRLGSRSMYLFVPLWVDYEAAALGCRETYGGHLSAITSLTEQIFLTGLLNSEYA